MKTLEEIENALHEWQEFEPEERSVSLVVVRSEKTDADGRTESRIFSSFGGDLVALTAAHFNLMRNNPTLRRMFLAVFKAYMDSKEKNLSFDDEEEEEAEAGNEEERNAPDDNNDDSDNDSDGASA